VDLTPFRNRDYRFLYAAQFVSLIGTMVTYVALPYQMYRLTGSLLSVGLLGLVELVPLLATAFIGGAMADAVDRRRIAIVTDVALAVGSATLAIIATRAASASLPYLVAAWMSAVSGLQRPAIESLVPRLIEKHQLPAAASLAVVRGSVGMIAGPALGRLLIASTGLTVTYLQHGGPRTRSSRLANLSPIGVTTRAVLVVARGQDDDRVAIDGVSLQIALEHLSVNPDALDDCWTRTRDRVGHVLRHLRDSREQAPRCCDCRSRQSGHASI
jgi:MFS family permease